MSGSKFLIGIGEQELTLGVIDLYIPLVLILIERHLGIDVGLLGNINLLGALYLRVLEDGEECVLQNSHI